MVFFGLSNYYRYGASLPQPFGPPKLRYFVLLLDVSYTTKYIFRSDGMLSMDNVCNRRLFSFTSKVEMAEE